MDSMHEHLTKSLLESSGTLQKNFATTQTIIRDVTERVTKLDETNKQILGFSTQLQSLENILKNPKHRGILGEYWLETLLGQVLQPAQYQMQFELGVDENTKSKLIADAVIFVRDLVIPIDAKFSLENYNRISQEPDITKREVLNREFKSDVKKRIDETSKYIHPERGTTNFAFMFVPAEGVYYNLLTSNVGAAEVNSRDLVEYAFSKGVMIVSPTSFFAYLQTVIMGLKALQIEESVKDIQKQAEHLMRHLKAYEDYHNKIGRNLEASLNAYTDASGELKKIDKDIFKITDGSAEKQLEPVEVKKLG
jgi:DNA recombination protein RmuC